MKNIKYLFTVFPTFFLAVMNDRDLHFAPADLQILHILYDKDILQEDAILRWADEKEGADESDKVFVRQSEKFIQVRITLIFSVYAMLLQFYHVLSYILSRANLYFEPMVGKEMQDSDEARN